MIRYKTVHRLYNRSMTTLNDIEAAAQRLQGQILETPCVESRTLSQIVTYAGNGGPKRCAEGP